MKKLRLSLFFAAFWAIQPAFPQDVGELILRGYVPNTTINPYAGGTIYQQNGINNPYEGFGAGVNNDFNNPIMEDTSRIFDENGVYRGP
jgi:hypothetical protein